MRKQFREILNELLLRKAPDLLSLFYSGTRRLPKLTRKWRERQIETLTGLIEQAHIPDLRRWVKKATVKAEVRFSGRTAKNDKAIVVRDDLLKRIGPHSHLAYVSFARGGRCLKVGRSDHGLNRIASQWDKYYFRDATRVAVYYPKQRKKKILPALECALHHVFNPFHLYQWPPQRKFLDKCRACHDMTHIRNTVRKLFPA